MTRPLPAPFEHAAELAGVFRLMGDPSRLSILLLVLDEARSVLRDMAAHITEDAEHA